MPTFRITLGDGRAFDVEADRQPTPEEVQPLIPPAPPAEPKPRTWIGKELGAPAPGGWESMTAEERAAINPREAVATAVEVGLPIAGSVVGGVYGGPPGAAAGGAAGGAAGSALADLIRGEDVHARKAAANAVLGAIPGGGAEKIAEKTGAKVLGKALLYAGEGGVIGAGSTQAKSLIETGELASAEETAKGALFGAALGGGIGALSGVRPKVPEAAENTAVTAAEGAEIPTPAPEPAAPKPREQVQAEIFDDAGYVRPTVTEFSQPTTEGATARSGKALVDAVKAEAVESAELLASTEAAKDKQRLFRQVGELFERGNLDAPGLVEELRQNGLSMPEFIKDYYLPSVTRGARLMQQLSDLSKHLEKTPGMEEAVSVLAQAHKTNRVVDWLNKLNDTRRALLISQVKTGVRNAYAQGVAATVDLLEAGMTGGVTGMRDNVEALIRASSLTKSTAEVDRLLALRGDLRRKMGDFEYSAPTLIGDNAVLRSTIGKMTEWTTAINRWQEMFYRHAKFDATIRQELRKRGLDVAEYLADPAKLDELGILDTAVEKALELTFAQERPGGINTALTGIPKLLVTSIAPFPRYMANAAVYVAKRNPLGLIRLATTAGRQNARQVMAEAATGTLLLGGALALRFGDHAGERWYEVKAGDKRIDLRGAAGPFAPYLFAADTIKQVLDTGTVDYTGGDVIEGILSMNRMAGTAATMLSWLQGNVNDPKSWSFSASRLVGDWLSGFSVPFRNIKDALTIAGREEEGIWRDTRDYPLTGPTRANLPGVTEQLPASVKLTTGESAPLEHPVLAGIFGLNVRSVEPVEREINALNIPMSRLAPKTGIPKLDRELYRRVGKLVSAYGPQIVESDGYKAMSPVQKGITLRTFFRNAQKAAKADLKASNPRLYAVLDAKNKLKGDRKALLEEQGIDVDGVLRRMADESPEGGSVELEPVPQPETPAPDASTPTPADTADPMETAARLTGIDPDLLEAVVMQESGGNPNALGPVTPYSGGQQATGLMQLLPSTFESLRPQVEQLIGRRADIFDPLSNLVAGSLLYQQNLEQTGGNIEKAAELYHGGPNLRIHGPKTRAYGRAIARRYAALQG